MVDRKTAWGKPGSTGVTDDGIPWYVPEKGPHPLERVLYWLFPVSGKYMPPGARFVPARTAEEVRERCLFKYKDSVAQHIDPGEEILGFVGFVLDDNVPQPPRTDLGKKVGPNRLKHWWMGGDWDTMAGQLLIGIGSIRVRSMTSYSGPLPRHLVFVRTASSIVILRGDMDGAVSPGFTYGLDQVGVSPGWQPNDHDPRRIDIAFADGSWLGLTGTDINVPGDTEGCPIRDLLAELAGPPVTTTVLPARGIGS